MRPKIIPQELSIKKPFFWGLFLCGLSLILIAVFWGKLPPEVPLFFSKPRGEDQLAPTLFLIIPGVLGTLLIFANSIFAQIIGQYPLLKRMLALAGTAVCVLTAITTIRVLLLVL